ncbi:Methyltransferase type 11 [Segniliparus rotundus DSM 44985]|uniref:Methyltransferase type 11 n=1 Tax=Segniliparus rotundus (strain ATCC BAA-972 / CDC 1076 / CIP 108378 / DSM 44985 / JCM 13578) TaxID=640132 RepID=D6ZBF7_SEGRD|nr:class I SAM-dependent methyltransferase [Segniliparus rotundus]ADG98909.1 Methyltransferase type 11 [Segniliparus rotundus DSM 44985]
MAAGDPEITDAYSANAAFWTQIIREGRDKYQTGLVDRALFEAIGPCEGKAFLDAGCGEGYFSRELARRSAGHVHAVDACAELVAAARDLPDPAITYHVADIAALPLPDNSVDVVVANRLPHGLADPGKRFFEFARALRPGGRLVSLALHPCYYTARDSQNEKPPLDEYFEGRMVVQHFEVDGLVSPEPSVQRFFSLEEHVSMILRAGFVITGLTEPRPTPEQFDTDPWWQEHYTRPLFLLLQCRLDA